MPKPDWQLPEHTVQSFHARQSDYCVVVPVINEGERIKLQIAKMSYLSRQVDIVIADGNSQDNSLDPGYLKANNIRALLIKQDKGKLSAQLRMAYAFALQEGYAGIITIDGNGKDNVEAIPEFVKQLQQGADFIQGSRFVPGGQAINTPLIRWLAIKLIHAPVISLLAGKRFTDTTNGYRGYSRKMLLDERVKPFRDCFNTYELLAYLSVRPSQLKMRTMEVAVTRAYPPKGKTPTKINLGGLLDLLKILLKLALKCYHPK